MVSLIKLIISKARIVHHGNWKRIITLLLFHNITKQACSLHMKMKQIDKRCLHIEEQFKKLLTMYFI